jgi:integrase
VHALTPDTEEALYAYLYYDRYEYELGSGAPLILSSVKGGKLRFKGMTVRGINKRIKFLGEKCGVFQLSPHDCRHYWATDAARSGTDPFALKQAGGWTSMSTVARYIDEATIANEGVRLSTQRRKTQD